MVYVYTQNIYIYLNHRLLFLVTCELDSSAIGGFLSQRVSTEQAVEESLDMLLIWATTTPMERHSNS